MKTKKTICVKNLIVLARTLLEPGEEHLNPEYTLALIELCCEAAGLTQDDKPSMARKLGVPESKVHLVV